MIIKGNPIILLAQPELIQAFFIPKTCKSLKRDGLNQIVNVSSIDIIITINMFREKITVKVLVLNCNHILRGIY